MILLEGQKWHHKTIKPDPDEGGNKKLPPNIGWPNCQIQAVWLACIRWQLFISSFIWSHLIRTFVCCWKNLLLWLSSWFFPFELLGSAEKPMAGPSSCKGKIMRWEKFQIIGSKHKCSYYLWSGSSLMVFWCHFCPSKRIT